MSGHDHIVLEDAVTRDEKVVDGIELEEGTGDIALEDATDNSGGFLVLNSTSGASTNSGSMFDLEKGTLNDVLLNSV